MSDAQAQKERKEDRRRRLVCIHGEAKILVGEEWFRVDHFVLPLDEKGYPTRGIYKNLDGNEVTFRVADATFEKHEGAAKHNRCRHCWPKELQGQKKKRESRKRGQRAPSPPPPTTSRRGRRAVSSNQGAFSWAA